MKRWFAGVSGWHQQRNKPDRGRYEAGRRHLDLARRQQTHSIGSRVIVRIVLVPVISVRMVMVGVSMSVVFMLVLLMNDPRMLKQRVRRCRQPHGDQQQHHDLLHTTH